MVSLIYCSRNSIIGSSPMVIYSDYRKYMAHRCIYYSICMNDSLGPSKHFTLRRRKVESDEETLH